MLRATAAKRFVRHELVALLLMGTAIGAVALFVAAAHVYPGGTHFDRLRAGHDFWRNTICDIARSKALGGATNHGASLARVAMMSASLGLGSLFWLLADRFASRPYLSAAVRGLGALVVPGGIAVALLPTDRFSAQHGLAIVMAGIPGLVAAILATYALIRDGGRHLLVVVLGVLAVAVSTADFSFYVHELLVDGPPRVVVSVLERIASLLIVAWMLVVATMSLRRPRRAQGRLEVGARRSCPDRVRDRRDSRA